MAEDNLASSEVVMMSEPSQEEEAALRDDGGRLEKHTPGQERGFQLLGIYKVHAMGTL